jgi:hypothetical protein
MTPALSTTTSDLAISTYHRLHTTTHKTPKIQPSSPPPTPPTLFLAELLAITRRHNDLTRSLLRAFDAGQVTAELKERDLHQCTLKREREIQAAEDETQYVVRRGTLCGEDDKRERGRVNAARAGLD